MNTLSNEPSSAAPDTDWDRLAEQWRSKAAAQGGTGAEAAVRTRRPNITRDSTAQLARRVRRQSRLLWLAGAAELFVSVLTLLLAADFAFGPRRSEPWSLPTAAGLVLLVFVAGRQAWSTRRGLWTASSAHDHADYVHLLQRRLRAREEGLAFSWRLTAALFVAFCIWLPLTQTNGLLGSFVFLVFWCGCAAAWIAWLGRRARRERDGLEALRRALHEESEPER